MVILMTEVSSDIYLDVFNNSQEKWRGPPPTPHLPSSLGIFSRSNVFYEYGALMIHKACKVLKYGEVSVS